MVEDDEGPLARAVKTRRLQLGLAQGDLAGQGGPGIVTVRDIEKGKMRRPRDLTLAALDRALRWEHGSAEAVVRGGQARPLPDEAARSEAADSVATGSGGQGGMDDDEVLALVETARRLADELEKRVRGGS